jgi:hypothetical protein
MEILKGRSHLRDIGVVRIILKCILKKLGINPWTGFMSTEYETVEGCMSSEHGNTLSASTESEVFLEYVKDLKVLLLGVNLKPIKIGSLS